MKYVRWYDEDPYLSPVMKILEKLPVDIQESVAQDLVQIVMSAHNGQNDTKIEYLNNNLRDSYRRWYDANPNLLSSIEILKTADNKTKKEVCESVLEFLFQILVQEHLIDE